MPDFLSTAADMTSSTDQDLEKKTPPPEIAGNLGDTAISIDDSEETPQSGENQKKDANAVEKDDNEENGGGGLPAYRVRQASSFLIHLENASPLTLSFRNYGSMLRLLMWPWG